MPCELEGERLERYLDREMAPAESRALEEHLAGCETCRKAVAERRRLREAVRRGFETEAPAALREAIARSLSASARPSAGDVPHVSLHRRRFRWWPVVVPAAAVAAAFFLIFVQPRLTERRAGRAGELPFSRPSHVVALRFGEPVSGDFTPPAGGLILEGERP